MFTLIILVKLMGIAYPEMKKITPIFLLLFVD